MVVLRQKVAFVGDGTCGKTAIVQMGFSGGVSFPRQYLMTLGCDLAIKEVQVGPDITVELYMHDIAGQDIYKKNVPGFIEGLDWFVAVYDLTSKTSFENISRWIEMCKTQNKNAKGVIVANKTDLRDKAETSDHQGEQLARSNGVPLMQTSALRNAGVTELLKHIADETAKQYEEFVAEESKR